MSKATKTTMLEIEIGAPPAASIVLHAKWKKELASAAALTLPLVACLLLTVPGTPFEPTPAPKEGKFYKGIKVTEALLASLMISHIKYLTAVSDQLMALFFLVVSSIGPNVMSLLENHPIYIDNKLQIPGDDKVHLLLQAVHSVCSKREGSTKEESYADIMESIANLKMGRLSFSEYCEMTEAQCDAARSAGIEITEKQEVEFTVRGLERDFLPVKQALMNAAAVTGTGLPATRSAFRTAAVRIEASLGNETSAFSAKVKEENKPASKSGKHYAGNERTIFDEGYKAGAKKGEAKAKLIEEQLAAAMLTISELEKAAETAAKATGKSEEAAKPNEEKQRNLPAGFNGKNQMKKKKEADKKAFYVNASESEREWSD